MAVSSRGAWRPLRSQGRLRAGARGWHCAGVPAWRQKQIRSLHSRGLCSGWRRGGRQTSKQQQNRKNSNSRAAAWAPLWQDGQRQNELASDLAFGWSWLQGRWAGLCMGQGGQGPWSPIRPECVKKRKRSVWPSGGGPGGNGKAWGQWAEVDMVSIAGDGDVSVRCKPRRSRRRRTGVVKSLLRELFFFFGE